MPGAPARSRPARRSPGSGAAGQKTAPTWTGAVPSPGAPDLGAASPGSGLPRAGRQAIGSPEAGRAETLTWEAYSSRQAGMRNGPWPRLTARRLRGATSALSSRVTRAAAANRSRAQHAQVVIGHDPERLRGQTRHTTRPRPPPGTLPGPLSPRQAPENAAQHAQVVIGHDPERLRGQTRHTTQPRPPPGTLPGPLSPTTGPGTLPDCDGATGTAIPLAGCDDGGRRLSS